MLFSLDRYSLNVPSWLYSLRWVAILGMGATIAVSQALFGVAVPLLLVVSLIGFLILWNLASPWLERHFPGTVHQYAFLQVLVDLVVLTAILWCSGGLVNPFASFYVLHVLMAGLLLTPVLTGLVAFITVMLILSLLAAGPLVLRDSEIALRDVPIWMGVPVGLILLVIVSAAFILVYLHRLKLVQEESLHREKMAAVGRLVAGMAHEMGTPLNVILLLAKDLLDSAPASYKEDLQTICSQAKRCGELVSLLLGYSQPDGGYPSTVNLVTVTISSWIEEIFQEAKKAVSDSSAALHLNVQTSTDAFQIRELVVRQVMFNLIKNSVQATCDKSDALISINVSEDSESDRLKILVRDNGPGFSKEHRERAFEAFFTTKEPGEGDGLGLYISYYLMEQIGGEVSIPRELQAEGGAVDIRVPYNSI